MRIALVDANKNSKLYSLPLLKLGAWLKDEGHYVELFDNRLPSTRRRFNEIWLSTIFTYHLKHSLTLAAKAVKRTKIVRVGGIASTLLPQYFQRIKGVKVHHGLHPKAEKYKPDYSLLPAKLDYAITHTSRGCVRNCEFCAVRKIEPKFTRRDDWVNDLPDTNFKMLLFYDNNWLAKPKKFKKIDFNQALDARLLTDELADLIKGLPFDPLRFAFDGMHEDGLFQAAIEMMVKRGQKNFKNLMLYNWLDTPEDLYYRMRECVRLSKKHGIACEAFLMRFQPIEEADVGRKYVGKFWTLKERNAVGSIVSNMATKSGIISCVGGKLKHFEEFEFWFGKNKKEFRRLLNYPQLNQLLKRKAAYIRLLRAKK